MLAHLEELKLIRRVVSKEDKRKMVIFPRLGEAGTTGAVIGHLENR